jgi:sugar (pentulose or hexulose) kinase
LHIVGGGTKNQLLNQFTADATKKEVVCGPSEATALGNIMMQAVALGNISSIQEGREVIRRSCEVSTYQPKDTSAWDEAYQRFLALL